MTSDAARVAWVDYAKGFCIIMVVTMHSTLGVEKAADATGWMNYVVAFATPFRMPDFFMISGLFLARVIERGLAHLPRQEGVPLRLFLHPVAVDPARLQDAGTCRRRRRGGGRPHLADLAHRSVRHDLVHLPAADLLRAGEGDEAGAVVDHLADRRRAPDRQRADRMGGAGRIRRALRLFLFGLHLRAAHLPLRCAGAEARLAGGRLSPGVGRWSRGLPYSPATRRCPASGWCLASSAPSP